MPQEERATGIIGDPLMPASLAKMGVLPKFPSAPPGFQPDGAWLRTYGIFTCHGYVDDGNFTIGVLKLERSAASGGIFTLKVNEQIAHSGGPIQKLDAEVRCRQDATASPVSWTVRSRVQDWDGKDLVDLAVEENGRVAAGVIEITRGGRTARTKCGASLGADFSLFEAVQRMPFRQGPPLQFDLLEAMSLLRQGHKLRYDGPAPPLGHRFHHLGYGVGPYEYWLDERHQLLLVASHGRAYIFDEKAEEHFRQHLGTEQNRTQRKSEKKGKR